MRVEDRAVECKAPAARRHYMTMGSFESVRRLQSRVRSIGPSQRLFRSRTANNLVYSERARLARAPAPIMPTSGRTEIAPETRAHVLGYRRQ